MRRFPRQAFPDSIDLGSGSGSPIEVDYFCKESLASLPFLQRFYRLSEAIRGDRGPQICTGSIVHAHWRYYLFSLLKAGFVPDIMLKEAIKAQSPDEVLYPALYSNLQKYMERWSYEGIYNYRLYREYLAEHRKVTPILASYYKRKFRFSDKRSRAAAHHALMIFMDRAAGSSPKSWMEETGRIVELARMVSGPPEDLESFLGRDPPDDDVRRALNIALLKGISGKKLALLVNRLPTLDYGDESPLFFALNSRRNTQFLLDRGAKVDYQNGFGKTPLYYAIGFNDHKLTKLLLDSGADVNHKYASNTKKSDWDCTYIIEHTERTPLMHAAQHSDTAMLRLLIERGARLDAADGVEYNAADYAMKARNQRNAAFLESRGVAALQRKQWDMDTCTRAAARKNLKGKEFVKFSNSCISRKQRRGEAGQQK